MSSENINLKLLNYDIIPQDTNDILCIKKCIANDIIILINL